MSKKIRLDQFGYTGNARKTMLLMDRHGRITDRIIRIKKGYYNRLGEHMEKHEENDKFIEDYVNWVTKCNEASNYRNDIHLIYDEDESKDGNLRNEDLYKKAIFELEKYKEQFDVEELKMDTEHLKLKEFQNKANELINILKDKREGLRLKINNLGYKFIPETLSEVREVYLSMTL